MNQRKVELRLSKKLYSEYSLQLSLALYVIAWMLPTIYFTLTFIIDQSYYSPRTRKYKIIGYAFVPLKVRTLISTQYTVDRKIFAVKIFSRLPQNEKNLSHEIYSTAKNYHSKKLALHRYFQPQNGLPDPKGSISSIIPSRASVNTTSLNVLEL